MDRDEPVGGEVVGGGLQPEAGEGDREWMVRGGLEEYAHQYFPITSPPSTRTYAPVTILDARR